MVIKLTLIAVFAILGTVAGRAYSKRLTVRRRYFEEMISLINSIIGDIKFRQSPVAELVAEGEYKAIKPASVAFVRYVSGEMKSLKIPKQELTDREYSVINEMFSVLGTYDLETQVFVLDNYKAKLSEFYTAAREKESRYAATAIKLGLLIGLAAGVVAI